MALINARGEMPFLDHLEELRWRIFKAGGAVMVSLGLGWYLVRRFRVTQVLVEPIEEFIDGGQLAVFKPTTPFFLELKLALIVGLILVFPILMYQVWAFLSPALEKREKRMIVPALYMGMVLFAIGAGLAYLIALPVSLDFLFGFQTDFLHLMIGADEYLAFVVRLLLAFGIIFELPVVVLILSVLGLVTPAFLRKKRRHAVVLITVTASVLSPSDVLMVTVLMMVPLFLLYEFSIFLSVLVTRSRSREEPTILPPTEPPEGAVEAE